MTAGRRAGTGPAAWLVLAIAGAAGVAAVRAGRRRRVDATPVGGTDRTVVRTVTVDRPVERVGEFWRDPDRMTTLFDRPVELTRLDDRRWRCVLAPGRDGGRWSVEITAEPGDRLIQWRTDEGPTPHTGRLWLAPAPGDRGTELRAELSWTAGPVSRAAARLGGGDPDRRLRTLLRRAKALLECGTLLSTDHEPAGRGPLQERVTRGVRHALRTGGRP